MTAPASDSSSPALLTGWWCLRCGGALMTWSYCQGCSRDTSEATSYPACLPGAWGSRTGGVSCPDCAGQAAHVGRAPHLGSWKRGSCADGPCLHHAVCSEWLSGGENYMRTRKIDLQVGAARAKGGCTCGVHVHCARGDRGSGDGPLLPKTPHRQSELSAGLSPASCPLTPGRHPHCGGSHHTAAVLYVCRTIWSRL